MGSFCYILLFRGGDLVGFLIPGMIVVALYGGGVWRFAVMSKGIWDFTAICGRPGLKSEPIDKYIYEWT